MAFNPEKFASSEKMIPDTRKESEFSIPPLLERVPQAYMIYVGNEEDVEKIVREFWEALGNQSVLERMDRGMLHATDTITEGPRTLCMNVSAKEKLEAGYRYGVHISQNGPKLRENTEAAVLSMKQRLGI